MSLRSDRFAARAAQSWPLLLALALPAPAAASSYQALCGNTPCTITLDPNGIAGMNRFIPIGRIARWYTGGQETYDRTTGTVGAVGGGTAGAIAGGILLGPIGLLGGMVGGAFAGSNAGKSADLYFSVVGYDSNGVKSTLNFRFINPRPASLMRQELPMYTGLAMGQTRSLAELERNRDPLPSRLSSASGPMTIPSQSYVAPSRYR
jgi:hypothetical protein